MTDIIAITPGSGDNVHADSVTINAILAKLQNIRLVLGGRGVFQDYLKQGQQAMANSISVALASDTPAADIITVSSLKAVRTALLAATDGGATPWSFLSTAAVQASSVKASAGQVYALHFFNDTATIAYVRLYDMATAPAATDTPVWRGMVPANTSAAGFVIPIPPGLKFGTGIGIRVTAGIADNDATALSANQIMGNVIYA